MTSRTLLILAALLLSTIPASSSPQRGLFWEESATGYDMAVVKLRDVSNGVVCYVVHTRDGAIHANKHADISCLREAP